MMNKNTAMVKVGSGQLNVDIKDIKQLSEAVVHNSNGKLQLKSGGSEMLLSVKGNGVNFFIQEGNNRIMYEAKLTDVLALKELFNEIV